MKSLLILFFVIGIAIGGIYLWERIRWAKKRVRYIAAWKDLHDKEEDDVSRSVYRHLIAAAEKANTEQEFSGRWCNGNQHQRSA